MGSALNIWEFDRLHRKDRCAIIIKAQPHRSSNYFETVCCAGIGADGKWRRQYPVPFRILNDSQKFKRWGWIKYEYTDPGHDRRFETQKVTPETIELDGEMKHRERSRLLNPLIRSSLAEADNRGESLAILRPSELTFGWAKKSRSEIDDERRKHADLANQLSLFDKEAKPLEPCPYEFTLKWRDQDGKIINHTCDDWESVGAFFNFKKSHGETRTLQIIKQKYEVEYFERGLVLGFSTHTRRNVHHGIENQWLLVGLIRLDRDSQGDLFLGAD